MNAFKKIFTNQNIQMVITIAGVAILLIGTYITIRIAPLSQDNALVLQAQAQQREDIERIEVDLSQKADEHDIVSIEKRLDSIDANIRLILAKE